MYATSSACIDCGKCLRKCPVGAIRRTETGYYVACINCGECARICPSKAIKRNARGGYYVDRSKCTGCGLCAIACPINIIRMENGRPGGICMNCGICASACPAGARIQIAPIQVPSVRTLRRQKNEDEEEAPALSPTIEAVCP